MHGLTDAIYLSQPMRTVRILTEVKAKLSETKEHVLAFLLHQGVAFEALEYGNNRINGLSNELLNVQGQVDELEEACELVWGSTK